jgi:hypothetical protein
MTRKPVRKSRTAPAKAKKSPRRAATKQVAPKAIKRPAPKPPAKPVAQRKPSKPVTTPKTSPLDSFIDAAASVLGLTIEDAWRPAVAANLRVTFEHAASVEAFALPDDAEPAPIFKA